MTYDSGYYKILALRSVSMLLLTIALAITGGKSMLVWFVLGFTVGLLVDAAFNY